MTDAPEAKNWFLVVFTLLSPPPQALHNLMPGCFSSLSCRLYACTLRLQKIPLPTWSHAWVHAFRLPAPSRQNEAALWFFSEASSTEEAASPSCTHHHPPWFLRESTHYNTSHGYWWPGLVIQAQLSATLGQGHVPGSTSTLEGILELFLELRQSLNEAVYILIISKQRGSSLVIQWLRCCLPNAWVDLIPGQVAKINLTCLEAKNPKHKTEAII